MIDTRYCSGGVPFMSHPGVPDSRTAVTQERFLVDGQSKLQQGLRKAIYASLKSASMRWQCTMHGDSSSWMILRNGPHWRQRVSELESRQHDFLQFR